MPATGYNEADTRAKLIDPALHSRQWIELVEDNQRATHGEIHREQCAVRVKIINGKGTKADSLLPGIEAADKAARKASSKAQAIDDAVYDLKAVNPREKKVVDTRTPAQLLEAIADKGKEVEAVLTRLSALL